MVIAKRKAGNGEKREMANRDLTKPNKPIADFEQILKATCKANPDPKDLAALRELMKEDSLVWQIFGDLANRMESIILSDRFQSNALLFEALKMKLANMRDELGWNDSTEMEKLLIQQVCMTWLRLYLLESTHYQNTAENSPVEIGIYWDKRLAQAQKRHLKAVESLAKVRKLTYQSAKLENAAKQAKRSKTTDSLKVIEIAT